MKISKRQILFLSAAGLAVLAMVAAAFQLGAASAQQLPAGGRTAVAGVTSALLQYQGRLSDPASGAPLPDGAYTMALRLYDAPSGGTPLWSEVKDVPVQDGLFSTILGEVEPLEQDLFDGRALWLGIKVGADSEAVPRQQVLPAAYALGLVPGAAVQANSADPALTLANSGAGPALSAAGPVLVEGDLTVDGKLIGGAHTHTAHNNNPSAHHTRYTDAEAVSAALSSPEIVTQYEFQDHIYGGMHSGRALAYGVIKQDGSIASASSNVSSSWNSFWQCFEISIDGVDYDWRNYVAIVTPVTGGIASAWSHDGKLCVGIYNDSQSPAQKVPFQFAVFQP